MGPYDVGDIARVSVLITDADGNPSDPASVTVTITKPDSTSIAGAVAKDSIGAYHADVPLDQVGLWSYLWTGTGAGPNISEYGTLDVRGAPTAFASVEDLRTWLGTPDTMNEDRARLFLETASGLIRSHLGTSLAMVTDEAVTYTPITPTPVLMLPDPPVISLGSVVEDGRTLTDGVDFQLAGRSLIRVGRPWATLPRETVVTYSHGYAVVPAEVKGVCIEAAARMYTNSEVGATIPSELAQPTGAVGWSPEAVLSLSERATLDRFAKLVIR